MLASITPLGERGRGSTWAVTMTAFALGATVAGALAGALLGGLGGLAGEMLGARLRLELLAAALAVALALDMLPGRVPGPRRQVDERWLDQFRGWVYGLGYGAQLGVGVLTVVSSAATYVALAAAILTGSPPLGAVILGTAGLVRGATPLAAAHVRRPDQLIALHGRLERWQNPVRMAGRWLLVALLVGAASAVA